MLGVHQLYFYFIKFILFFDNFSGALWRNICWDFSEQYIKVRIKNFIFYLNLNCSTDWFVKIFPLINKFVDVKKRIFVCTIHKARRKPVIFTITSCPRYECRTEALSANLSFFHLLLVHLPVHTMHAKPKPWVARPGSSPEEKDQFLSRSGSEAEWPPASAGATCRWTMT